MRSLAAMGVIMSLSASAVHAEDADSQKSLYPGVQKYVDERAQEFDQISSERKQQLKKIAAYVENRVKAEQPARLTFICTHNSRRSHMSQIWAAVAARDFGIDNVEVYSGGTEATAFNPRAVAAMERAGLKIENGENVRNPHYAVRFQDAGQPLICFSKIYSAPPNPDKDFCAVMTCSHADEACPVVAGCSLRIAIPYEDPKAADGTPAEAAKYDERCAQISREMLYLFSQVGK